MGDLGSLSEKGNANFTTEGWVGEYNVLIGYYSNNVLDLIDSDVCLMDECMVGCCPFSLADGMFPAAGGCRQRVVIGITIDIIFII